MTASIPGGHHITPPTATPSEWGEGLPVSGFESLIGFEQLGKLYLDAATNLRLAAVGWTDPASGSCLGARDDLAAAVERVESVLAAEIAQWGQLRRQPPTAG